MSLQHSGSSISGEYTSGTFTGTISGDQVSFEEDGGGFRFTGTISSDGKRMQGSLSALWDLGANGTLPLSGNWTASR